MGNGTRNGHTCHYLASKFEPTQLSIPTTLATSTTGTPHPRVMRNPPSLPKPTTPPSLPYTPGPGYSHVSRLGGADSPETPERSLPEEPTCARALHAQILIFLPSISGFARPPRRLIRRGASCGARTVRIGDRTHTHVAPRRCPSLTRATVFPRNVTYTTSRRRF